MTFDEAFERTVGFEGGYVCDPRDPGGETCYGISKRSYPGEDIRGMSKDRAKFLYRRDFWGPAGCDAVPREIAGDLFDLAVNSGVGAAVRALQRAAGVVPDGILGPATIQAASSMPVLRLRARLAGERLQFMTNLATWPTFGRGWARRVADILKGV